MNIIHWLSIEESNENVLFWVNTSSVQAYPFAGEVNEIDSEGISSFIA